MTYADLEREASDRATDWQQQMADEARACPEWDLPEELMRPTRADESDWSRPSTTEGACER